MTIEYRPTPDHDWMPFSGDTLDEHSLRIVNAVCGYEKYRLVDTRHESAFGEEER
jgi:hypothetical protein